LFVVQFQMQSSQNLALLQKTRVRAKKTEHLAWLSHVQTHQRQA